MNIYDIAKTAGVSIATVSKALSGKKDVSESTRKRIINIAEENGYKPSIEAQALARLRETRKQVK